MSDRILRYRLGMFVIVTVVLLAAMVVMFGSINTASWFRRTNQYTITLPEAPGITPGSPVRRSGVRIGEVSKVELNDETGEVSVTVAIDKRFSIRRNETPTLSTSIIGGDSAIEFIVDKGKTDHAAIPAGETIAGARQPTVGSLLRSASEVDVRKLIAALDRISPATEETLKEFRDLARETRTAVPEFRKTNAQIQEFVKTLNDTAPEVKETNKELQALIKDAREVIKAVKDEVPEIRSTSREIQKFVKSLNDMVPDVKQTNKDIQTFIKSLNEVVPDVRQTNKDVQTLIKSVNDAVPEVRQTNKEIGQFVKSLNETVPDLKDTNKELQKLLRSANELTPEVKTTVRDIGAAAQQFNKLGEDAQKLLRENQPKIARIVDNLNASLDRVMDLLSNENRRNITDTIRNIRTATDKLPEMTKNADETLKEARTTAQRLRESMAKADEVLTNLQQATRPLAERSASIMKNLDETLDRMNRILGDLRELMRAIGESDGVLRRILTDPALYNHLDDLVCGLGKMLPRLDRVLKDVETFADKLARHPESIGIGGVVRPGSGLKEPPAAIGPPTFPPQR